MTFTFTDDKVMTIVPDNSTRNQAIRFYGKIRDIMNDDSMNIMNFFKYDNDRVQKILAL